MTIASFGATLTTAFTDKWLGEKLWTPFQPQKYIVSVSFFFVTLENFLKWTQHESKNWSEGSVLGGKKIQRLVLHQVKCHMGESQEEDYHLRSTPSHTITTTLIFMGRICLTRSRDVFSLPWRSIWIINQHTCIPWKHSLSMNPHGNGFVTSLRSSIHKTSIHTKIDKMSHQNNRLLFKRYKTNQQYLMSLLNR